MLSSTSLTHLFSSSDTAGICKGIQSRERAERSGDQQIPRLCLRWNLGDSEDPHPCHEDPQRQGETRYIPQLYGG